LRFLLKLLLVFAKIVIITLVFEKNDIFFCRKLAKIAENSDHNIDPWGQCYEFFTETKMAITATLTQKAAIKYYAEKK
jgi:hypothetical protein